MKDSLKRSAYSVVPMLLLWLWQVYLAPDLGVFEYCVLVILFAGSGMAQFADGFERGMK